MLELRQEFAFLTYGEVLVLRRIAHRCGRRAQEGTNRAWTGLSQLWDIFKSFRFEFRAWLPQTLN